MADATVAPPPEPEPATINGKENGAAETREAGSSEKSKAKDEAAETSSKKDETKPDIEKPKKDATTQGAERAKHDSKRESNRSYDRGSHNKYSKVNNSMADYSSLPDSEDPAEIRKQVEFYFSDANLARDRFLFDQTGGPANKAVPLDVLCSFKRMRRFKPRSAVVAALQDSTTLDVVADASAVQRKVPFAVDAHADQPALSKVFEDAGLARSIYAKGFGAEQPTTQFDIEAFFAAFGPTNQVRLRRSADKTFKESVFVEFDREDTAKAFLAADPPPSYQGTKLKVLSKKAYLAEKAAEPKTKGNDGERDWRERRDEDKKHGFRGGRGGSRGGRGRGRGGGGGGGGRDHDRHEGRHDRDGGRRDRDREPRDKDSSEKKAEREAQDPDEKEKKSEKESSEAKPQPETLAKDGADNKRSRGEEGGGEEPPAKKQAPTPSEAKESAD